MSILDFFRSQPSKASVSAAIRQFENGKGEVSSQFLQEQQANPPAALDPNAAIGVHFRKAGDRFDLATALLRQSKTDDPKLAGILARASEQNASDMLKRIPSKVEVSIAQLEELTKVCKSNLALSLTFELEWEKKGRDWTTYRPGPLLREFNTLEIHKQAERCSDGLHELNQLMDQIATADRASARKAA